MSVPERRAGSLTETRPLSVLLVGGGDAASSALAKASDVAPPPGLSVAAAETAAAVRQRLSGPRIDVLVFDLSRAGAGADALRSGRDLAMRFPYLVLLDEDDEEAGLRHVEEGAQDYLVLDEAAPGLVWRAVRYAVEHHRMSVALRDLALVDEATGLHNRRGFLTLAEEKLKVARREQRHLLAVVVDVGRSGGDGRTNGMAAHSAAVLLRNTFRASDLVARVDDASFVVLAVEFAEGGGPIMSSRLRAKVDAGNASGDLDPPLRLAARVARLDPATLPSAGELLDSLGLQAASPA
jgi:two-component system, cell cycle response regulator